MHIYVPTTLDPILIMYQVCRIFRRKNVGKFLKRFERISTRSNSRVACNRPGGLPILLKRPGPKRTTTQGYPTCLVAGIRNQARIKYWWNRVFLGRRTTASFARKNASETQQTLASNARCANGQTLRWKSKIWSSCRWDTLMGCLIPRVKLHVTLKRILVFSSIK